MRDKTQLTSRYCLQIGLSPSVQTAVGDSTAMSNNYHFISTAQICRRSTLRSPVTRMLCQPSFVCRGFLVKCSYQTHLPLTWPMLMFLTIYWEIGWYRYPTCPPMWKSNYLQGQEEGASARVIAGCGSYFLHRITFRATQQKREMHGSVFGDLLVLALLGCQR